MRRGAQQQPAVTFGQVWQECDNRHPRLVEVIDCIARGVVVIRNLENERTTTAKEFRFNGKHGGYRYIAASKRELKGVKLQGSHGRFAKQ